MIFFWAADGSGVWNWRRPFRFILGIFNLPLYTWLNLLVEVFSFLND